MIQKRAAPPAREIREIDRYDQRYECCGGRMHSVQGCRIIGLVEIAATILAIVLLFVFFFVFYSDTYAYQLVVGSGALAIGLICCLCAFGAIFTMFVALRHENPVMLAPHIAAQVIALIGMGFASIVAIVTIIGWTENEFGSEVYLRPSLEGRVQDQYAAQKTGFAVGIVILILSVIGFVLECWFLAVVISTFRYFKDKARTDAPY